MLFISIHLICILMSFTYVLIASHLVSYLSISFLRGHEMNKMSL